MVIEFELKYTYPLTNDSLTQICGINTAFCGISCGYGIFLSVHIRQSFGNFDWGYFEYTMKKSLIRKYLKVNESRMSPFLLFICHKNSGNFRLSELVDKLIYFFTSSNSF